jgi:hypothetical protein
MSRPPTPPPVPKPRAPSSSERDIRRVPTPPAGVAAQLAVPLPVDRGDKTDPHAPLLEQINKRTQTISSSAEATLRRFEQIERESKDVKLRLTAQDDEIALIKLDAKYTRGKIDAIADNAEAQRQEREAKRAHELEKKRIDARNARWGKIAAVITASAGLLLALAKLLSVI